LTDKFFWADTDVFHFSLPITTAERHYNAFFSSGHTNKKIITQVAIMKKRIVIS